MTNDLCEILKRLIGDYGAFSKYGAFGGLFSAKTIEQLTKEEIRKLYFLLEDVASEESGEYDVTP